MLRVFIADDHKVVIEGLSVLLESIGNYNIVGSAANGLEAYELAVILKPDVIFMDIDMPVLNGIESAEKILKVNKAIKIIFFSMHAEMSYLKEVKKIGAHGFLLKNSGRKEIEEAINTVLSGQFYFGNDLAKNFLLEKEGLEPSIKPRTKVELSQREIEIVKLICIEKTMPEISIELGLSEHTAKTHRKNILKKIGVKNTAGLVRYAIENHIV